MKHFLILILCIGSCSLFSCKEKTQNQQASNITEDNKMLLGSVIEFSPAHQILAFKLDTAIKVVVGEDLEVHRPMQGKLGKVKVTRIDEENNAIFADTIPSTFTDPNPDIQPKDTIYRVRD